MTGWNPVFNGKYSDILNFGVYDYVPHMHYAIVTNLARVLYFKDFNKAPARKVRDADGRRVYEWDLQNIRSKRYEEQVPDWYIKDPFVQITEFKSWEEVAQWGVRFYQNQTISGPLKAKIEGWKKESDGNASQYIALATRFVQDEIRYLGVETGENSHRQHQPEDVFRQRYGDCKWNIMMRGTRILFRWWSGTA